MKVLHTFNLRDLRANLPLGYGPRSLRSLGPYPSLPTNFSSSKPSFPWCYGPEFVAKELRKWLAATGSKTLYIEPGSPWENGYCESFNSKMRDEFLNGEIFYSLREVRVLTERWRVYFNTERPHSSLRYRAPAPEARLIKNMGHGEVETATRFPLLHTPDGGYLKSKITALH